MYVVAPTASVGTGYWVTERYCGIISILREPPPPTHTHTHTHSDSDSDSVLRRHSCSSKYAWRCVGAVHSLYFLWPGRRLVHLLVPGRRAAALAGDDHNSSPAAAASVRPAAVRPAAATVRPAAATVRADAATVRADTTAVRAGATCHGTACGIGTTTILRLLTAHIVDAGSADADRDAVVELPRARLPATALYLR